MGVREHARSGALAPRRPIPHPFPLPPHQQGREWVSIAVAKLPVVAKSLFDPAKAAGAEQSQPAASTDARPLTVSQASDLIKNTLERHTPGSLRVVGQMSNLSARDHWYFSLKDDKAVLPCVAWKTTVAKLAFRPTDGDEVVVSGHLSHYGPQGKTQLYVSAITPVGAGALELKFRALCEELRKLGYFDDARKRPLPMFPRRIAVVTSSGGAAVHDVINTAAQRCKAVGLLLVDVKVQGEGAAEDVARAIKWVDARRERLAIDAIIVTRGGGSIEDLWAFNERIVADAIFHCHLPIVAAIGHESDTSIAELVADVRASTPTQAAMRLVPAASELARQVHHVAQRIDALLARMLERRREATSRGDADLRRSVVALIADRHVRLQRAMARLARLRPEAVLAQRSARLVMQANRLHAVVARRLDVRSPMLASQRALHQAMVRHLRRLRERIISGEKRLTAVDPHGVLRRGYSITSNAAGEVIKSVDDVRTGEAITTRVRDGAFRSLVSGHAGAAKRTGAKPPEAERADDQFDLFH